MTISAYDTTADNNGTVLSVNIAENCAPANLNNAIREVMADIATDLARANGSQDGLATGVSFALPRGVVVMWSGALTSIPDGWALCDGTNSTPDLQDRFVVSTGTTYTAIGNSGGADSVTLAEANIPEHDHNVTASGTLPNHVHSSGTYDVVHPNITRWPNLNVSSGSDGYGFYNGASNYQDFSITGNSGNPTSQPTVPVTVTESTYGSATPTAIDNRPAYYALAFIMKL